jgi:hypothetical protein
MVPNKIILFARSITEDKYGGDGQNRFHEGGEVGCGFRWLIGYIFIAPCI